LKFNEEEGQYKAVVKFFQEQRKYRKIHQDDSQDIRPHSTGFGSVWHYESAQKMNYGGKAFDRILWFGGLVSSRFSEGV
jgi:hypothetical protein